MNWKLEILSKIAGTVRYAYNFFCREKADEQDEYLEMFINTISVALEYEIFICDYNHKYPLSQTIEMFEDFSQMYPLSYCEGDILNNGTFIVGLFWLFPCK